MYGHPHAMQTWAAINRRERGRRVLRECLVCLGVFAVECAGIVILWAL